MLRKSSFLLVCTVFSVACGRPKHEVVGRLKISNESDHTVTASLTIDENSSTERCSPHTKKAKVTVGHHDEQTATVKIDCESWSVIRPGIAVLKNTEPGWIYTTSIAEAELPESIYVQFEGKEPQAFSVSDHQYYWPSRSLIDDTPYLAGSVQVQWEDATQLNLQYTGPESASVVALGLQPSRMQAVDRHAMPRIYTPAVGLPHGIWKTRNYHQWVICDVAGCRNGKN